jgi:hypothetical protein
MATGGVLQCGLIHLVAFGALPISAQLPLASLSVAMVIPGANNPAGRQKVYQTACHCAQCISGKVNYASPSIGQIDFKFMACANGRASLVKNQTLEREDNGNLAPRTSRTRGAIQAP